MSLYSKLRNKLSDKNRGRLTQLIYKLGLKPTVNKKTNSFDKGVIVFSADFEMAWAFRFSKRRKDKAVELGLREREQVLKLVDIFDHYNIPVTWATVGHLFLSFCEKKENNLPHPDMIRPKPFENKNWYFNSGDWYQHDPCTDYQKDPAWYAPDLIQKIINAKAKHEIGCHTFSHCDFSDSNCSKEMAESELNKCVELANKTGVKLKSMVFPGGTAGNYTVLKEKGIISYRKPMKYHIDMPILDQHGLVSIPSSHTLEQDPYGWSEKFHIEILKSFVKKTVKSKKVCHFWFHPSLSPWYLENVIPKLLHMIDNLRSQGKIEVLTMSQLAEKVINND